jgi:hypothetical protein
LRSDSAVLGNRQFVTLIFTVVQPIKSGEQGNFRADQRSERQVWGQSFMFVDRWSSDRSAPIPVVRSMWIEWVKPTPSCHCASTHASYLSEFNVGAIERVS